MIYESGFAPSYKEWQGKYANRCYTHFARHDSGRDIKYKFNNLGYRGYEHFEYPDITVFGSSFSFGVGIDFENCWHQQLGDYKVNCLAPAGILVTNNDIINHYHDMKLSSGKVILQLREFRYNKEEISIPSDALIFVVDEQKHPCLPTFLWSSFIDKAEDSTHPGVNTHRSWAKIIKKIFNL